MQFDKTDLQIKYKNDPVILELLRDLPDNTTSLIRINDRFNKCQQSYHVLERRMRSDTNEISELLGSLESGHMSQDTAISSILRILNEKIA